MVKCQHCDEEIHRIPYSGWVDDGEGFNFCSGNILYMTHDPVDKDSKV